MKSSFTELAIAATEKNWQASFHHPFITELQQGSLAPEIFRYYLLQDRYYLENFGQLYQKIALQTTNLSLKKMMQLNGENLAAGELAIRENFFVELAIDSTEITKTEIAPTAYHYVSHLYHSLMMDEAVAFAAMLPCAWLYQDLGQILIKKTSPIKIYQRWIETYSDVDQEVRAQETNLVNQIYLESLPDIQEKMLQAFKISTQLEYQFWEMAYQQETWKR